MGIIKPSYDTNRQVLGKIYPLDTPFNVILDTSEACNFKCSYCFRADNDKSHWGYAKDCKLMKWDLFVEAIEQIKEFPNEVKQISLSNHGEPLCNRKLPDMVRYIKDRGINSRVSIHTNASLLDDKYIKDLADCDIDRVVISLQGMTSDSYKRVCSYDLDYNQFYSNIKMLFEVKKKTQIYIKVVDVALKDGEDELFISKFKEISDRVYIEKTVPIWKNVNNNVKESETDNKYGETFAKQKCCPLTFHTIVISPNGDVYPCTQLLVEKKLGNIKEKTLLNLWNCDERKEWLKNQLNLNASRSCEDCYILQNSVYSKEDMIDDYREEILRRF